MTEVCPHCGATRSTHLDGTYAVGPRGWYKLGQALRPDGVTREDYLQLAQVLVEERARNARPVDVAAAVEARTGFKGLGDWLRANPWAPGMLTALIAVIAMVVQHLDKPEPQQPAPTVVNVQVVPEQPPTPERIQQWIREAVERAQREQPPEGGAQR